MQVTHQKSLSTAKRPRTSHLQPPACTHKEHDILTSTEATTFAAQFWDRKAHPTKALQQEFLGKCIDVDVDKNVRYKHQQKYTIKRGYQTKYFVPYRGMRWEICNTQFVHYFSILHTAAQSVAKVNAAAAITSTVSPIKSPHKQGADNTRQTSLIKQKFENFCSHFPRRTTDLVMLHVLTLQPCT